MEAPAPLKVTVQISIKVPVDKAWQTWTTPDHIMQWNNASDDWHMPRVENDVCPGGHFLWHMQAKDGSFGFDFVGVYDEVIPNELLAYTLNDGRKVSVTFSGNGTETMLTETFEIENENPIELQRNGWQAILNNFKKYTEAI